MLLNRVSVRTLDDGVAEGNVCDVLTRSWTGLAGQKRTNRW